MNSRDELYQGAVDVVVREGRGSVSLLQRVLGIGYGRAARLIDYMEEDGFVGPYNGSQAREILITVEDWEAMSGQDPQERPAPPPERPTNKILISRPPESRETEKAGSRPRSALTGAALTDTAAGTSTISSYEPNEPPDAEMVEEDELEVEEEEEEDPEETDEESDEYEELDEEQEWDEEEEEEE